MSAPITSLFIQPGTLNVGIGTSQPRAKLEIAGGIVPSTNEAYDLGSASLRWRDLYLSGNSINLGGTTITRDSTTGGIKFIDPATNQPLDSTVRNLTASNLTVLGDYVTLNTVTSNTEQMVIQNAGTGPALKVTQTGANSIAEFYDDGNALALKIADGGNVGIGAATPQGKLDVNGNITIRTQRIAHFVGDIANARWGMSLGNFRLNFYNESATNNFTDTANITIEGNTYYPKIAFTNSGGLITSGNIGIGTVEATQKLDVKGSINYDESLLRKGRSPPFVRYEGIVNRTTAGNVQFVNPIYDTHQAATKPGTSWRFTVPTGCTGYYHVSVGLYVNGGNCYAILVENAVETLRARFFETGDVGTQVGSTVLKLTSGNYYEVRLESGSISNAGNPYSYISISCLSLVD